VLDVIRQRADNATDGPWTFQHWGSQNQNGDYAESILFDGDGETSTYGLADRDGEFIAAARSDVPRLVAALTAALDLCDDPGGPDSWSHMFQGRQSVFVDDIRAVIEAALAGEKP
jgi:hypothetical protein